LKIACVLLEMIARSRAVSQPVRLLLSGRMRASPSLTVFLGKAGDAALAEDFEKSINRRR
jgi:hypothetical protein